MHKHGRAIALCTSALACSIGSAVFVSADAAWADGDDYPARWKNAAQDSMLDDWHQYNRECTSFVAWALHSRNGFELPTIKGTYGAADWGYTAKSGYGADGNPAVGSVAWWDYGTGVGHVAWVKSVSADKKTIIIEDYNGVDSNGNHKYGDDGTFSSRAIASSSPKGYIHFKDLSAASSGGTAATLPSGASPIQNGGFNKDTSHWAAYGSANIAFVSATSNSGTVPYEGAGFVATNATQAGDSIGETNNVSISTGDTFCASAQVVTTGNASGGSGTLALWLTGGGANEVSVNAFSGLPGNSDWHLAKTCVTATASHTQVKVHVYPTPGAPTIGVDAVDVHQTLSANGGFNIGRTYWNVSAGGNFATYTAAQNVGTNPYEGVAFGATNAVAGGGGIFEDLPRTVNEGDTFCAEAQVVTAGPTTGGAGALALWLLGGASNEVATYSFSNLPGGNAWSPAKTCVTATTAHSTVRVQVYPAVGAPTIGVDALDVHASIALNGGFNGDSSRWSPAGSLSYARYASFAGTLPYEGGGFEVAQGVQSGDSLYHARAWAVGVGDTFCAEASVVTAGNASGGSGALALWIMGGAVPYVSSIAFSGLPGGNAWTRIKTCVMAETAIANAVLRVHVYPTAGGPAIGVDSVDVH